MRKEAAPDCTLRILSRTDGAFNIILMAEARDFRCCPRVVDDIGTRSLSSDRAAIRFAGHDTGPDTRPGFVPVLSCCGTLQLATVPNFLRRRPLCEHNSCSIGLRSISYSLCDFKSLSYFLSLCSSYFGTSSSSIWIALLTFDVVFARAISRDFFMNLCAVALVTGTYSMHV